MKMIASVVSRRGRMNRKIRAPLLSRRKVFNLSPNELFQQPLLLGRRRQPAVARATLCPILAYCATCLIGNSFNYSNADGDFCLDQGVGGVPPACLFQIFPIDCDRTMMWSPRGRSFLLGSSSH